MNNLPLKIAILTWGLLLFSCSMPSEERESEGAAIPAAMEPLPPAAFRLLPVGEGWAQNSVNAVIFRRNSLVSHGDTQYIAYYDAAGQVVLGKRQLADTTWQLRVTPYQGNVKDAHNTISIMVDGAGFLHMSWDHHGHPLRYVKSVAPGSLELTENMSMIGRDEGKVTYPEFYRLPNGNLIFLYRDGSSGNGNLVMNAYDIQTQSWRRVHDMLIDGEGEQNAYWQMCIDPLGQIHLSWVWRRTGGVETNHDIGYARSKDGGESWEKSTGEAYQMPITAARAEYALRIPENSELINTTSMCADAQGRPYIASYWTPAGTQVPQYQLVYHDGTSWQVSQISERKTPFSLSGGGTKRIPISRPKIMADATDSGTRAYMLFRDEERGSRVSVAYTSELGKAPWQVKDLTPFAVDLWEPTYDTELWQRAKELHVFIQRTGQGDGESLEAIPPQPIFVGIWKP